MPRFKQGLMPLLEPKQATYTEAEKRAYRQCLEDVKVFNESLVAFTPHIRQKRLHPKGAEAWVKSVHLELPENEQ